VKVGALPFILLINSDVADARAAEPAVTAGT
jgi:hypothetical protein